MKCLHIFLAGLSIISFCLPPSRAWFIARRRRSCYASNCRMSSWGSWGSCSRPCGGGTRSRSRYKAVSESCGGSCPYSTRETSRCNTQCCRVDCSFSWGSWSPCTGCGTSTQSRTPSINRNPSCGGTACPGTQTKSCDTGVCCPVNCAVNNWGNWGSCNAACERNGQQRRTRSVRTPNKCGGTACPALSQSRTCRGGCCRRNCVLSAWSPWSSCNAPTGKCATNSGTQTRSRRVTRPASCGGTACSGLSGSRRCTPTPISCLVSNWSSWGRCTANNGRCGAGSQTRARTITRQPYCSAPCPPLTMKRSCTHSCCPVNCVVSLWSAWAACTATCGSGTKVRTRTITTRPSCNGQACPSLKETTSCTQYNNKDCVLSVWSSWSQCSSGCGKGLITKTRRVISQPVCQGRRCGPLSASKICTSYRDNRNCVVGLWGPWGACNAKCAVGSRQRTRAVVTPKRCQGTQCPLLTESSSCGSANGGCQHVCSNGVCSCRPGYNLAPDKQTCAAKNCGTARPRFCAQGTKLGSTCQYSIVTCPGGNTTYPVTCSLGCPTHYTIKGPSTITCQTNGLWTSYGSSYCRRNNDPPTQILLSGSSSVSENMPRGTTIGALSSLDPVNSKDRHTYTMIRGGSGMFEIRGAVLLTSKVFDFEASPNTFDITVRSTDNGVPSMYLDKTFTIRITDVNEDPTDIQLSSSNVNENSDIDTTVGMLSTADPDTRQSFTYQLLSNAGGRFKIVNNRIKVAQSNKLCLQDGGRHCSLNYEQQPFQKIRIRSTDSGSPSKSIIKTINITINDVNDKPRDIRLSNQMVKENAPINTVIGQLTARDEDFGQRLVFTLDNDVNGRFKIDSNGKLLKAKITDYEMSKVHLVTVRATDNGSPTLWISKQFTIVVLNVNEAPVSLTLDNNTATENSPLGTQIGTLTAVDKDSMQNLTFSLDDSAGGKFSLGFKTMCNHVSQGSTQCSNVLLVSGDLDFEDAQWELIIVRVTDDNGLFYSQNLNITVQDVNDKPSKVTLEGSLVATVNENSRYLEIGELQTVDQDVGQTFRYTLLSNLGGNFEIRGNKLFVSKSANLDYEKKKAYQISLRSTDSGNPPYSVEANITINISDLNEKPTDITLSKNTILENTPPGSVIGSLSIKDPDNLGPEGVRQTHTCQLKNSANGIIGIAVNQKVNQLTVGAAGVNYEVNSTILISVQCSDPQGLSLDKPFTIKVQDINEAPTDIVVSNLRVKENQTPPITVGRITVVDPDNENTIRQSFNFSILSSSAVPFAVQNGNLVTTKKLDFEADAQWSFRIEVQDSGVPAKTRVETFTVQVLDTNDQPTSILLSNLAVNENSAQDTLVGLLSTVDQDVGQNYTYQLIDSSNGRFMVDYNAIKVAQSNNQCLSQGGSHCLLNYEAARQQRIRVRSTDNGVPAHFYDTDLVILIRDVNDQPRDLTLSNNRVKENATVDSLIGQFNASDEDIGQSLSYSLADDDGGRFRVDSSGYLYKANSTNYETQKQHTIRAVVTDNGRPTMKIEKVFVIEVLDVNEAPVKIQITSAGTQSSFPTNDARVKENSPQGTVTGTLEALDHDYNQVLSFRLDDDANGTFILDSSKPTCAAVTNMPVYKTKCTTILQLKRSLNYEENRDYTITVRATDSHGLFTTQQLSITVIDQNDAPTNITLGGGGSARVHENSNGALVGVLATTDEDVSQTFTYTLTNDASGRFVVRGDKLYVSNSANLDFEKQSLYSVSIQSTDSGSPSLNHTKDFSITVLDLNEAPTTIGLTNSHVPENSKPGTVIGSLNVTDPDNLGPQGVRQSHTCSVVGSQIGKFVVENNVLKLNQATVDYEQATTHDILVNCVDNGTPRLKLQQNVSVFVDDVNEAPSKIALSSSSVAENSSPSLLGTLSTADPDNEGPIRQYFTYSIIGDTAGLPFIIHGNYLNTTSPLDYETQANWNLTVQSTDSGNPPKAVTNLFTISVVDVNEQPMKITLSGSAINENNGMDTIIGTLSCQDPDVNQNHTYTLTNTAYGRFKLIQNRLMVALQNDDCLNYGGAFCKINFEAQQQHVVRVRTTDNGTPPLSNEKIFTITVRDVNDRPRDLKLSGYIVKENATIGTRIGQLSAKDEDKYQVLSFSLVDDDNGRFIIDSAGFLVKAKDTDYESSRIHMVTVQVRDNGTEPLSLNKTFSIFVENVNEAPVNTSIISQDGQQTFPDDMPQVNENSPQGDVVGTIISLDHDEVQHLSFKLLDDAGGKFSLGSSVTCKNQTSIPEIKSMCSVYLVVSGLLNYEQSKSEDIVVRVTDPNGLFHTKKFTVNILNVNDKPSNITLSGIDVGYVDENANNAFVGDLAAVDEDANQVHTFRMFSNGGWKFVLKGTKIYTSRYANIDFEKQSSLVVIVRAMDNGRPKLFLDKSFTIQIRDVNEKPTSISLTNQTVTENSPQGFLVGKISVEDPDNKGPRGPWQVHTCSVFNNVPFIVNHTSNELLVAGDLNYEVTQSIDVILRCYDDGSSPLYIEKTFRIDIMDENEAPTSISLSGSTVAENSGIVVIGTFDTVDPDNLFAAVQTFSYSVVNGSGLPFVVEGYTLKTSQSLDYETKALWEIYIQSTDNKGLKVTRKFEITVSNRNDAPTSVKASGNLSIFENSAPATYIGNVYTADQDVGQTHFYQIESVLAEGHSGKRNDSSLLNMFSIGSTSGSIALSLRLLDFEQYSNYTLIVRAVDNGSPPLSVTGYISILVKDVNEAPTAITLSNNKVFENTASDSIVGKLSVQDPDNVAISWQKFTCYVTNPDQAPFKVVSHLSLAVSRNVLDFEKQNVYSVSVNCSERISPPLSISTTFTIIVLDVNEAPYNLTISNTMIPENGISGDVVGLINVLDPDTPGSTFANISLSIQIQSPSLDAFKIVGRLLVTTKPLDFEKVNSYQVTIVAMDSGIPPLDTTNAFIVNVTDNNDPPNAVLLNSSGIFENATSGTVVGELSVKDQDTNHSHTFVVISPKDLFSVNGSTLVLNNKNLDYETAPQINVSIKVTDDGQPPMSAERLVTVTVLDSNDPPSYINMTSSLPLSDEKNILVPENSPGGTSLASLFVVDQDISQSHTCELLDGQKYFVIPLSQAKSTAQVLVNDAAGLDYETMYNKKINVTVRCTDSGNPPYSKSLSFSVAVSDMNEAPFNITLTTHPVPEHPPEGYVVGSLSCQEPDFNQNDTFRVVGGSSMIFEVNQASNLLVVKDPSYLDYEALQPNHTVTVRILATDSGAKPLSASRDFILHVINVNEPPFFEAMNVTVREDIARGRCVAQINVKDPDLNQTVKLSLLSHEDKFDITNTCISVSTNGSETGGWYLSSRSPLSYDNSLPDHVYDVLIEAKDNGQPTASFNESAFVYVERVNPCDTYHDCNGNATCVRLNGTSYTCLCKPGFTGDGRVSCVDINECESSPCSPHGTCHDGLNAYLCTCDEGYTGSTSCDPMDYCASNPCFNNATCVNTNRTNYDSDFFCICLLGYTERNCSVEINECDSNPCSGNGNCTDGINRFSCACLEGYTGTQCQRSIEACNPNPCDTTHHVCVPRNLKTETSEESHVCVDSDFVIPIYFKPKVFSLELVATSHWKYQLQAFVKGNVQYPLKELNNDEADESQVVATDLFVVETSTVFLNSFSESQKRERRSSSDNIEYTAVYFVVKHEDFSVPQYTFFVSLNKTCITIKKNQDSDFGQKICDAAYETMIRVNPMPKTGAQEQDAKAGLHPYMYYVFIGAGALVFLLLLLGVILLRRDRIRKRQLQAFQIHDKPLDTDGFETDVMQRHQLSNDGEGEGTLNPMYGIQGNVQPSFDISENPLYSRPDDTNYPVPEDLGFSNPIYQTFQSVNLKVDDDTGEPFKVLLSESASQPLYQTPRKHNPEEITTLTGINEPQNEKLDKKSVQTKNKKKKKKAGKKQKALQTDDDDSIPDIAAVNPMFQSRGTFQQAQDDSKDEEGLYAVPRRKTSKNKSKEEASLLVENPAQSMYDTPKKVIGGEGMSNLSHQSPSNLECPDEPLPGDIVSAFSGFSTTTKTMGEEPGQSEC